MAVINNSIYRSFVAGGACYNDFTDEQKALTFAKESTERTNSKSSVYKITTEKTLDKNYSLISENKTTDLIKVFGG
jgi:hypothetical protein